MTSLVLDNRAQDVKYAVSLYRNGGKTREGENQEA